MLKNSLFAITILLVCLACTQPDPPPPNVLFIAVDDLRPELGVYGNQIVHSPNIDALGEQAVVFRNHFVTVPTCGASRAGLLTGLLPASRGHLHNQVFRDIIAKQPLSEHPESFVHHLRQNGYYTVGIGKITHSVDGLIYEYGDPVGTEMELPHSWDEMLMDYGSWGTGWNTFFAYAGGKNRTSLEKNVKPYEAAEVADEGYPDGLIANLAMKKLGELAGREQPFFMGVGFFKPHLPFNAPKKYWDLYDDQDMPVSPNPMLPENVNPASLHGSGEFNQYKLGEEKASLDSAVSEVYAKKLMHAYLACVSYTDAQIGKVLSALDSLNLMDNTLVVLWSDHGWHLGDHRVWGKHTIFDKALRSPLIIKPPKSLSSYVSDHVVSTVDIYPTIAEICGLPPSVDLDGRSLLPLLNSPEATWQGAAYSYYRDGISVKTPQYRLTKYFRDDMPAIELYDHQIDPLETENIATKNPRVVDELLPLLEAGDTGLYD